MVKSIKNVKAFKNVMVGKLMLFELGLARSAFDQNS